MQRLKIVLDTNVFVAGVVWSGPPATILDWWQRGVVSLVLSDEIFDEYTRVGQRLQRDYQGVDFSKVFDFLLIHGEFCKPVDLPKPVCEDPDDNKFLSCALASRTNIVVSGDKHLLHVSGYAGVEVLKPKLFLNRYMSSLRPKL